MFESFKIESLTFQYSNAQPILKGIYLQAKASEIVGIAGQNGAGKSTLFNSLTVFNEMKGSVFINDIYTGFLNPIMPFISAKIGISMAVATVVLSISNIFSSLHRCFLVYHYYKFCWYWCRQNGLWEKELFLHNHKWPLFHQQF